jgi:hypothetical protein
VCGTISAAFAVTAVARCEVSEARVARARPARRREAAGPRQDKGNTLELIARLYRARAHAHVQAATLTGLLLGDCAVVEATLPLAFVPHGSSAVLEARVVAAEGAA